MDETSKKRLFEAFEAYRGTVFGVDVDLRFWQSIVKDLIGEYQLSGAPTSMLFSAVFHAYNLDPFSNHGYLKTQEDAFSILKGDLENHRKAFFAWVTNLSILKIYNALEIFLIQAIHLRYFPNHDSPIGNKDATGNLNKEIKAFLTTQSIKVDTKNNRHLICFLRNRSVEIASFLEFPIRVDLKTSWQDFFELVSILRNVIAHQGTIVGKNTHNEIKSRGRDIFHRHFVLSKGSNGYLNLVPIEESFSNFIIILNDFAVNCVKLMFNEKDLSIFDLT